ncbi:MAG: hypothetical protein ABIF04_07720 [Chloroflexota bacterium]
MDKQTHPDSQLPQQTGPRFGLSVALRPGALCPECGTGKLDYNGLLEMECLACGYRTNNVGVCT